MEKIDWGFLSANPNAIHLLEKNIDKISWIYLSQNPNAIHLLKKNMDKINWIHLSANPKAIHILENNLDLICWYHLSKNPNAIHLLTRLDTDAMRKQCQPFAQELCAYVLHPLRLTRLAQNAGLDLEDYIDLI